MTNLYQAHYFSQHVFTTSGHVFRRLGREHCTTFREACQDDRDPTVNCGVSGPPVKSIHTFPLQKYLLLFHSFSVFSWPPSAVDWKPHRQCPSQEQRRLYSTKPSPINGYENLFILISFHICKSELCFSFSLLLA